MEADFFQVMFAWLFFLSKGECTDLKLITDTDLLMTLNELGNGFFQVQFKRENKPVGGITTQQHCGISLLNENKQGCSYS